MYSRSRTNGVEPVPVHYVVPIGGAPFVPPLRTMMDISGGGGGGSGSSSVGSSNDSAQNDTASSPTSSPSSSPTTSIDGVFTVSSPSSPTWQAAVEYSSALHAHTRRMWENERMNIERARLGLDSGDKTGGGGRRGGCDQSDHSASNRHGRRASAATALPPPNTSSSSSGAGLQKRSTISGSVDALFRGRSRRQNKNVNLF